jgi:D-beta-D-heptose 7-phosphate kinase/D-beta-D-heptose 1-phosphate adenosyltransferase
VEDRSALPIGIYTELLSRFASLLGESDLCIISDYGKGVVSPEFSQAAIQLARKQKKPIVVDPKGRDYGKYMGCTLLTPNQKEASVATDIVAESESDVLKAGKSLLSSLPGSSVLITRGPDGMTLFCPNADPLTISTEAQNVFDVVGAGDTVIATLGVSMAARLSLETAVTLSNIAAGIVVGKHGTVAITREELLACANTSTTLRNALHGRLCA